MRQAEGWVVVDSSALLCIVMGEPEAERMAAAIARASVRVVSAFSLLEASTATFHKLGAAGSDKLDAFMSAFAFRVVPFDEQSARSAAVALREFGKVAGHPARLNIGDACSYVTAKASGIPLLFKGNDFSLTDVVPADW
jgi:ribonuclease VapC